MSKHRKELSYRNIKATTPMRRVVLILGICLMLVSVSMLSTSKASAATENQPGGTSSGTTTTDLYVAHSITVEELVALTNKSRSDAGLPALVVNQALVTSSNLKATDMATRGYFAHVTPEGRAPWYWFAEAKYDYQTAGENLAVDFTDSHSIQLAWMKSLSHRKNILNADYTEIGISLEKGLFKGHDAIFVVVHFGSPRTGLFF